MNIFSYCAVIRTLGKSGEMYQKELESLINQTVQPKKILVFIAEGYPLPKQKVGMEEYIYVPKGMVAQRALDYDKVDTDYILMLDDDVYLPPNAVERMFYGLNEYKAGCVAADVFHNQDMSTLSKIKAFITNSVTPHTDDKWAFKVKCNGAFSYNKNPTEDFYESQSAAGPASFWKKESFLSVHFDDEKWMDDFPFAYGDDLLLFYKAHLNGVKLMVYYFSGIVHLDAGTGRAKYNTSENKLYTRAQLQYILWWRLCYNLSILKPFDKIYHSTCFSCRLAQGFLLHLIYSISILNIRPLISFVKGSREGWKFVRSEKYRIIPNVILDI